MSSVLALVLAVLAADAPAATKPFDEKAAFERLRSLTTWTGSPGGQETEIRYEISGAGNAVLEVQHPGQSRQMHTVYFLDRGHLVGNHYCVANQPHVRLDTAASTPDRLVFAFDGGTNLDPAKDGHMHDGVITFKDGAVESDWTVVANGKVVRVAQFLLSPK
jgi:hypothetical protein